MELVNLKNNIVFIVLLLKVCLACAYKIDKAPNNITINKINEHLLIATLNDSININRFETSFIKEEKKYFKIKYSLIITDSEYNNLDSVITATGIKKYGPIDESIFFNYKDKIIIDLTSLKHFSGVYDLKSLLEIKKLWDFLELRNKSFSNYLLSQKNSNNTLYSLKLLDNKKDSLISFFEYNQKNIKIKNQEKNEFKHILNEIRKQHKTKMIKPNLGCVIINIWDNKLLEEHEDVIFKKIFRKYFNRNSKIELKYHHNTPEIWINYRNCF